MRLLTKDSRAKKAYDYLYNAIVKYDLAPGAAIVEQDISEALGISRTPVRAALNMLESEGLLRHVPLRGTFVTEISTQDVEEIFMLREALEVLALHVAIQDITDQELAELEKLLLTLCPDSSPENFYAADRRLHEVIVSHGHNRRLMVFLKTLNSQIERVRQMSARRANRLQHSIQEHLHILEALKERDVKKAERMLRQHIHNVKESTLEVCKRIRSSTD
jgi:DNA-binding GntR family transcriptional regulator